MHEDFVPCIQGVRVLCKPWLILSFINGPIVTPSCQYNHNDLSVAQRWSCYWGSTECYSYHIHNRSLIIEERPRVCLSSALYNYISRHDKYSVTTHCQVVHKVLQVSNIVFV